MINLKHVFSIYKEMCVNLFILQKNSGQLKAQKETFQLFQYCPSQVNFSKLYQMRKTMKLYLGFETVQCPIVHDGSHNQTAFYSPLPSYPKTLRVQN